MLNRANIMRSAWSAYRMARLCTFLPNDSSEHRAFYRPLFAKMLTKAWADAKRAAADAARAAETEATARRFIEAQRNARIALAARMTSDQRSARISAVRDEIALLAYAPWGVRVADRRADLTAELDVLSAGTAAPLSIAA
jgi:hypothetical protein